MAKVAISLDDKNIEELKVIIMDKDKDEALKFFTDKIQSQILSKEKGKLFFGKLGTKAYFKNRGKEMNKKQLIEEIKEIERKVEELKKNVPVHSPRVSMMQELEDLEEKLNVKKKMLSKTENTMEISEWKERLEREREEKER